MDQSRVVPQGQQMPTKATSLENMSMETFFPRMEKWEAALKRTHTHRTDRARWCGKSKSVQEHGNK